VAESDTERLTGEYLRSLATQQTWDVKDLITMQFFILQNLREINQKLSDWLWLMQGKERI